MSTSASPFDYLAVIPPDAPRGSIRSQEATADRLARHVAVLFGVDVPNNPAGQTWVADYERLRVKEIAQGALTANRDESQASLSDAAPLLDVIAMATLQRYGPDNKAALVLAGCEVLFNSVLPIFRDVLGIIGISSDTEPVATTTILAAWSLLVAEMVRTQPALAAAAIKARAIQAESYLEWKIIPTNISLANSERPRDVLTLADETATPRSLSILDETIPKGVSLLAPRYGRDARNRTLVNSLISNFCHYLLDSPDQMAAWVTSAPDNPKSHRTGAFLSPMALARTFASEVLAISPWIRPLEPDMLRPPLAPETFQRSEEQDGGFTNQGHTNRLLPRRYSAPEIKNLSPSSQRALLMTHMRILQVFRGGEDFASTYLKNKCREESDQIVRIAGILWGDSDPMTVFLRMHSTVFRHSDFKNALPSMDRTLLYEGFVSDFASLFDAWESGLVPDGVWISSIFEFSSELRQALEHLEHTGLLPTGSAHDIPARYWNSATNETGLRDSWSLAFSGSSHLPLTSMHMLFHNYLAIPFRSSNPREILDALTFSWEKLVPLRHQVAKIMGREASYRRTLQTVALPIDTLIKRDDISSEIKLRLADMAKDLEMQLKDTSYWRYHFTNSSDDKRDPSEADLIFLSCLARIQIVLLEYQQSADTPRSQMFRQASDTIRVVWKTFARIHRVQAAQRRDSIRTGPETTRFNELAGYEKRFRDIAESYHPILPREINTYIAEQLAYISDIRGTLSSDSDSNQLA